MGSSQNNKVKWSPANHIGLIKGWGGDSVSTMYEHKYWVQIPSTPIKARYSGGHL